MQSLSNLSDILNFNTLRKIITEWSPERLAPVGVMLNESGFIMAPVPPSQIPGLKTGASGEIIQMENDNCNAERVRIYYGISPAIINPWLEETGANGGR